MLSGIPGKDWKHPRGAHVAALKELCSSPAPEVQDGSWKPSPLESTRNVSVHSHSSHEEAAGSTAQQSEEQKGLVYPLCTTCSTPNIRRTHLEMSCWVHLAAALPSGVGTVQIRHELTETGSDIKWTTTLPSIKSFILQSVELLQNKNKVHAWLSNLPATQLTWCLCGPHDATLTGSPVTV